MDKFVLLYSHSVWDDNGSDYFMEETFDYYETFEKAKEGAKSRGLCTFEIAELKYKQKGDAFHTNILIDNIQNF